jgi:hypothetical protein
MSTNQDLTKAFTRLVVASYVQMAGGSKMNSKGEGIEAITNADH